MAHPAQAFLQRLQQLSKARAEKWHTDEDGNPADPWSLLEWAGAMCGESGEAANFAKKIKRLDQGMKNPGNWIPDVRLSPAERRAQIRAYLVGKCQREVADSILYGICLLNELGVDAEALLREVFNDKSAEAGFPERL